jgi:hypothetical protein
MVVPRGEIGTLGMLSAHGMADRRGVGERSEIVDNQKIGGRWIHRPQKAERAA